jgi:hypothetical protein
MPLQTRSKALYTSDYTPYLNPNFRFSHKKSPAILVSRRTFHKFAAAFDIGVISRFFAMQFYIS